MTAQYDTKNPDALRRLIGAGAQLRAFPRPVMEAAYKETFALFEDIAAKNPQFKKIYEPWMKFRSDQYLWSRVAENTFDNFVYSMTAAAAKQPAKKG
jgi:TRAP-type mannitol/chloroaromatic compound transport system substrate-binding protein